MLNPVEVYSQLNTHAEQFGYSTLTKEERFFLKRYKALHIRTGDRPTPRKQPKHQLRTWTGTSKRRRASRAKVWVDKSVATWKKPETKAPVGIDPIELLGELPAVYRKQPKKATANI